jgi:hypothetical protein
LKVYQGAPDQRGHKVTAASQVVQLVCRDQQAIPVHVDLLALRVIEVMMVLSDQRVYVVPLVSQARLDYKGSLVLSVLLDLLVPLVYRDKQEYRD